MIINGKGQILTQSGYRFRAQALNLHIASPVQIGKK